MNKLSLLIELSAHHTLMQGYYHFTFLCFIIMEFLCNILAEIEMSKDVYIMNKNIWILKSISVDSEGPVSEASQMRRLIWIFTVHVCSEDASLIDMAQVPKMLDYLPLTHFC